MEQPVVIIDADRADSGYWKDVWRYRGLFSFLAWRDLLVRYKQTYIGVAWALIRPLITIVAFSFFRWLMNRSVNMEDAILAVTVAAIPWQLFSASLSESSMSLVSNANLITKVYFPRVIVPLSTMIVSVVDFVISLIILAGLMIWAGVIPSLGILMIPVFMVLTLLAASGFGLFLSAVTVKYRDFRYVVPFVIQIGLFISPIAFSSDVVYGPQVPLIVQHLYSLNPMVAVIEGFRWAVLGDEFIVSNVHVMMSVGVTIIMLITGIWYFRKVESTFADVV